MKALEPEMIFPGEEIVHVTGFHWIYVFKAFLPFALVLVLGTVAWSLMPTRLTSGLIMLALLTAIAWVVIRIMDTIVKRCYVTNRRLINRSGWTKRDTQDVTLDRIGGMFLDQTPIERFLGYGRVRLIVPLIQIPLPEYLRNPIAFRNSLYIKPVEKPEDDPMVEEEARQAQEQEDDRFGTDTVSLKELQEMTDDLEGEDLGAELGADLGSDDSDTPDTASDEAALVEADDGGGADGGDET